MEIDRDIRELVRSRTVITLADIRAFKDLKSRRRPFVSALQNYKMN